MYILDVFFTRLGFKQEVKQNSTLNIENYDFLKSKAFLGDLYMKQYTVCILSMRDEYCLCKKPIKNISSWVAVERGTTQCGIGYPVHRSKCSCDLVGLLVAALPSCCACFALKQIDLRVCVLVHGVLKYNVQCIPCTLRVQIVQNVQSMRCFLYSCPPDYWTAAVHFTYPQEVLVAQIWSMFCICIFLMYYWNQMVKWSYNTFTQSKLTHLNKLFIHVYSHLKREKIMSITNKYVAQFVVPVHCSSQGQQVEKPIVAVLLDDDLHTTLG